MAESVVSFVIQGLTELLSSEVRFLQGIQGQLEQIQTMLRKLQGISKIADARQEEDEGIRDWVVETRDVAYDVEDVLATFAVEISLRREGSVFRRFSCIWQEIKSLHHLGPKIQVIEAKVSSLLTDFRVCNLNPVSLGGTLSSFSERCRQMRRSYSHYEEDFIGLSEDVEKLVSQLVNSDVGDQPVHVVAMVGMGGIGKTALARKVYHHSDVHNHFPASAWICISRQWQLKDVLQSILNKLVPEKREQMSTIQDVSELIKELYNVQKSIKCLVVLDDVWEMDVWDSLRPAFPNTNIISKVLLTTRNKQIAVHIKTDTTCYLYEQRHLNENESWELLHKKAFHGINVAVISIKTDMEELGKEMVGQCGGLPLAIIVLGGLLMTKFTLREWKEVLQNINSYLRRGRGLGEYGRVNKVLALSYHDLPYQLKPCFLHLGNFPEDYKISTRKLYQLWAAEGFIIRNFHLGEEEESITDLAERYLCELVQRSMFQVQVEESTGQLRSCQLHDLTRDLCILKGKEENFLKRIPISCEGDLIGTPSPSPQAMSTSVTRRLSISVDNGFDILSNQENLEHVRSVMFFCRLTARKRLQATLKLLCNGSKLLRVLDLERLDFGQKLPKRIGNLVHLRYLSLRGSQFFELPSSIGNLIFLQTLDLRVPFHARLTIPDVIWKLNNLRHLYLPSSQNMQNKLQLSGLSNLEILKNFDTRVSDFRDITKLTKLKKLTSIFCVEMENLEAVINYLRMDVSNRLRDSSFRIRYDFQSAKELTLLDQLVGCHHLHKLDLVGHINKLPELPDFSQRLTKLTLRNTSLKEDPMVILEKLPNLYSLMLRCNAFIGSEIRCSPQGFCQLRTLEIQGLTGLKDWIIEEGSMPNLQQLTIDECINLKEVPNGIKFVSTMKEMVLANMPEAFKRNFQVLQEEEGAGNVYKVRIIETNRDNNPELPGNSFSKLFRSFSPETIPREWQNPSTSRHAR